MTTVKTVADGVANLSHDVESVKEVLRRFINARLEVADAGDREAADDAAYLALVETGLRAAVDKLRGFETSLLALGAGNGGR